MSRRGSLLAAARPGGRRGARGRGAHLPLAPVHALHELPLLADGRRPAHPLRAIALPRRAVHLRREPRLRLARPRAASSCSARSARPCGPVSVGIDLRPSHLSVDSAGYSSSRDFLMNADRHRRHAVREVDVLRPGRPPATRGRRARRLLRALGLVPVGQGPGGPRRPLPAGLRRSARRPHHVHSRLARLRQQRPDLRRWS